MTIRFLCPLGHKLAVPDELAGKKGRCPECNQRVYIPRPDSQDSPAASGKTSTVAEAVPEAIPEAIVDPRLQWEGENDALLPEGEITAWPGEPPLAAVPAAGSGDGSAAGSKSAPPPLPGQQSDTAANGSPTSAWPEIPDVPPPTQQIPEAQVSAEELDGYQADPGKVQTVYMLAIALGAMTAFAAAPALKHLNLTDAPGWARVVLVLSAVQFIYICWMVSLPDWSTIWFGMLVFAIVAAIYGVASAVLMGSPDALGNFLGLDPPEDPEFREDAAWWCLSILIFATLLTYACGRISGKWRKQYELVKAARTGDW